MSKMYQLGGRAISSLSINGKTFNVDPKDKSVDVEDGDDAIEHLTIHGFVSQEAKDAADQSDGESAAIAAAVVQVRKNR